MKAPPTTYQSGVVTVTRSLDAPCIGCGKVQHRDRTFTGTEGEVADKHAAWLAIPVYCVPCWRKAGRPQ